MGRPVPFLLALCLAGCSTPAHQLQQGMTKQQVTALLGPPLRVEGASAGHETWFYNTVEKKHITGISQSDSDPRESAYERDLRAETRGGGGVVEITAVESYEEKPLPFDAHGRLTSSPPFEFVPTE